MNKLQISKLAGAVIAATMLASPYIASAAVITTGASGTLTATNAQTVDSNVVTFPATGTVFDTGTTILSGDTVYIYMSAAPSLNTGSGTATLPTQDTTTTVTSALNGTAPFNVTAATLTAVDWPAIVNASINSYTYTFAIGQDPLVGTVPTPLTTTAATTTVTIPGATLSATTASASPTTIVATGGSSTVSITAGTGLDDTAANVAGLVTWAVSTGTSSGTVTGVATPSITDGTTASTIYTFPVNNSATAVVWAPTIVTGTATLGNITVSAAPTAATGANSIAGTAYTAAAGGTATVSLAGTGLDAPLATVAALVTWAPTTPALTATISTPSTDGTTVGLDYVLPANTSYLAVDWVATVNSVALATQTVPAAAQTVTTVTPTAKTLAKAGGSVALTMTGTGLDNPTPPAVTWTNTTVGGTVATIPAGTLGATPGGASNTLTFDFPANASATLDDVWTATIGATLVTVTVPAVAAPVGTASIPSSSLLSLLALIGLVFAGTMLLRRNK